MFTLPLRRNHNFSPGVNSLGSSCLPMGYYLCYSNPVLTLFSLFIDLPLAPQEMHTLGIVQNVKMYYAVTN